MEKRLDGHGMTTEDGAFWRIRRFGVALDSHSGGITQVMALWGDEIEFENLE